MMSKMETYRKVYVYVEEQLAGVSRETEMGYSFQYSLDYLNHAAVTPISLTFPLSKNDDFILLCEESYMPDNMKESLKKLILKRKERLL